MALCSVRRRDRLGRAVAAHQRLGQLAQWTGRLAILQALGIVRIKAKNPIRMICKLTPAKRAASRRR